MKNIFKRNQIVITALAIMIAAAFYLNYAGRIDAVNEVAQTSGRAEEGSEMNLTGDISDEDSGAQADANAQVLDMLSQATDGDDDIVSNEVDLNTKAATENPDPATKETASAADSSQTTTGPASGTDTPGEAVLTSANTSVGVIAEAKLNREQVRAKNKETLLEIINNANISDEQKQQAIADMISLTDITEKEAAAELLLESKGYTDAVVSITGDSADVVIKIPNVSDAALAQIEDVVTRKTGVAPEKITITPVTATN